MSSQKSNPRSIFEINRLSKSRKVSSDLDKEEKEIQLPPIKDKISKDSFISDYHRQNK